MTESTDGHDIVLYDGVCNYCNASVRFVIARDPPGRYRFAALQSDVGKSLLADHHLPPASMETVVLIEGGKVYTRSTAALRVARRLTGAWPLLYVFIIVPRPIRDWCYGVFARNRYRWFGRTDACQIPSPEVRQRFMDQK
jgi:predicted DCC family thiol-disulfide oxidoreductase YuxK